MPIEQEFEVVVTLKRRMTIRVNTDAASTTDVLDANVMASISDDILSDGWSVDWETTNCKTVD